MNTLSLNQMEMIEAGACNGQKAINCITDAYSNHGWWSVALWVGTVVDPGIGVSAAAGCALGSCL